MDKEKKRIEVKDLDWEYGMPINRIREDLAELEKLGVTHIYIDSYESYGDSYLDIKAISERLETDEEFNDRINKQKKREADIIRREKEQLRILQLKYKS